MLQAEYERGTKDSDVLETGDLAGGIGARLIELAGPGTELHKRHRLYIEIVSSGVAIIVTSQHALTEAGLDRLEQEREAFNRGRAPRPLKL